MKRAHVLLLLAVLALPMGSCGGGGGGNDSNTGGGLDNSTFSGTYVLAQFSGLRSFDVPAAESTSATWGRVVADGVGMVTATVGENENGVISPPSLQPAAAYSVAADGTFTNLTSATSNVEGVISTRSGPEAYAVAANGSLTAGIRVGAISADGRYAFLCGDTSGPASALLIFIRK